MDNITLYQQSYVPQNITCHGLLNNRFKITILLDKKIDNIDFIYTILDNLIELFNINFHIYITQKNDKIIMVITSNYNKWMHDVCTCISKCAIITSNISTTNWIVSDDVTNLNFEEHFEIKNGIIII